MIRNLSTKKFSTLLIILFATNFLYTSFIHSASSLTLKSELSSPESDSFYGNNPYIGVNCTKLGEYDSNIGSMIFGFAVAEYSSERVAYISTEDSIFAYDYSDPKNPKYVTAVEFNKIMIFQGLTAKDNLLFVSFYFFGMAIIDFSNLKKPQILFNDKINNTKYIRDIEIKEDILYGRENDALVILDISNIYSPQFINKYVNSNGTEINSFYLENDYIYLIYDEYLEIIDVSDFTNPVQVGFFSSIYLNGSFTDIHVSGNIAYTVTTGGQLLAIDCSNKSNPILLSYSLDSSKYFNQISISESLAYVLDLRTGIHVFDITNPTEITLISRNHDVGLYKTQLLINNYLFLYDSDIGIKAYSILDHQNPELISIFNLTGQGNDIAISGKTVLVANGHNGLEIYQITTNDRPIFKSRILSNLYCQFVQIRDKLAYVYGTSPEEAKLQIIDFSDLENPVLLQTENILEEINDLIRDPSFIQVCGDFLIASYSGHPWGYPKILKVYDLTTRTNFDLVDNIEPGFFVQFAFQNNYLYLIDNTNLTIYSYEPQNSSLIYQESHNLNSYICNFHVSDNYAFISTIYDTHVFNIKNPLSPIEIFRFSEIVPQAESRLSEVVISDDIIYTLEAWESNLYFINFEDRNSPYLEGIFSCNESLTSFVVSENKVYLSGLEVNLEIVQLTRFIIRRGIIILVVIGSVISGLAVLVLFLRRKKIRKPVIQN